MLLSKLSVLGEEVFYCLLKGIFFFIDSAFRYFTVSPSLHVVVFEKKYVSKKIYDIQSVGDGL